MKLGAFGKVFALMFTDKMTISRYTETLNPDGTTNISSDVEPVYENVACRVSFNQNDNPESLGDDANPIFLQVKIFTATATDIRKGDYVVAQRLDDDGETVLATYEGESNLPVVYVTHKEAAIAQTGDA